MNFSINGTEYVAEATKNNDRFYGKGITLKIKTVSGESIGHLSYNNFIEGPDFESWQRKTHKELINEAFARVKDDLERNDNINNLQILKHILFTFNTHVQT